MSNDSEQTLRQEFAEIVAGFSRHLRWRADRGGMSVPAATSPRFGVSADLGADVASVDAPEQNATEPIAAMDPGVDDRADGEAPSEAAALRLEAVRRELGDCKRCGLSAGRQNIVFGVGSAEADLMFIGEAPGGEEDRQGEPFVGAAGQLLTKMIKAMGLKREEVYICNIIKCRPPKNRDPEGDEIEACEPFLLQQIDAIGPKIIVALGNFAVKTLLQTTTGITRMRGTWSAYHGIPVMPTFHPAYLLRNASGKRPAWNDLKDVMTEMDRIGLYRRREA